MGSRGVGESDGTEDVAGVGEDKFAAGEVRRGLSIRDPAGVMWSAEEGTLRPSEFRAGRETGEGAFSVEGSVAGGLDRRGEAAVDEGWLLVRCEIMDSGPALRRLIIRPESKCYVFDSGHDGTDVRATGLFGKVVIESRSWRVKKPPEAARDVGKGG